MTERVEPHEVVYRTVVANRVGAYARRLQPSDVGLALVAERIVLGGHDE